MIISIIILDIVIAAIYIFSYFHGKKKAQKNKTFFNDSKYTHLVAFICIVLLIIVSDIVLIITKGICNSFLVGWIASSLTAISPYIFTSITNHLNVMKYLLIIDDYININNEKLKNKKFNIKFPMLASVIEDYINKIKDIYIKSFFPYSNVVEQIENLIHNDIPKLKSNKENDPNCIKLFLKLEEKLFAIFKDNFTKYSPINKRLKELKKLNSK